MRTVVIGLAVAALALPATAGAATMSGSLSYCTEGDICRYFPQPRLSVTFTAKPGEANVVDRPPGAGTTTLRDMGAPLTAGQQCSQVDANTVSCSGGELGTFIIGTGDADDRVSTGGWVLLGEGDDLASGGGTLVGQGGDDTITGSGYGDDLQGGPGADLLVARGGPDELHGGRGRDRIDAGSANDHVNSVDGARDRVRCGRGHDRARVDRRDRVTGCERVKRVRPKR